METKKKTKGKKVYKPGSLSYVWNYLIHTPTAVIGMIVVAVLFILSFAIAYISPYGYRDINVSEAFQKPNLTHWMGTDSVGRDMLTRILYGAKYTIGIGFLSTAISLVFGVILGSLAGFFGGIVDTIIMRFLDILQSFPTILLAIALAAALGPGFWKIIIACGFTGITGFARMIRASILSIRDAEYVEAAYSINCSTFRIVTKHIIPNSFSPCIVLTAMCIAGAGLSASSLSFLGFGVQQPTPEWGALLSGVRDYIRAYPYLAMWPGFFIMIDVLCLNLVGDAVRDALDPRLRN